jgi:thiol-disulfide isomerase/thioredoxin
MTVTTRATIAQSARRWAAAASAGLVLLATAAPAALAAVLRCKPFSDYCVEVNGEYPVDAGFYQSEVRSKYLIDIPAMKSGLVMDLTDKKISTVPRSQISQSDGNIRFDDGVVADAPTYAFSIDGPVISFQAEDKRVRILPVVMRAPIVGPTTIDTLVAERSEYREGIKAYVPDAGSIAAITKYTKPVEIDAYFATWCPHCKEFMPKFLRVMRDARNPRIKLNLVGVPKGFSAFPGPWQGKGITSIPTIIVKIDGKEITRMGSHEGAVPEVELAGIFQAVR